MIKRYPLQDKSIFASKKHVDKIWKLEKLIDSEDDVNLSQPPTISAYSSISRLQSILSILQRE